MSLSRQLREALFRYGRRKPHLEYNRYLPGADYTGGSGRFFGGERLPRHAETYDPIRSEYATSPGYGRPDPWDDIVVKASDHRSLGQPRREPCFPQTLNHREDVLIGEDIPESFEHQRTLHEAFEPVPEALANVSRISGAILAPGTADDISHATSSSDPLEITLKFGDSLSRPSPSVAADEIAQAIDGIKMDERMQRSCDHLPLPQKLYISTTGLDDMPGAETEVGGPDLTAGPELPEVLEDLAIAHEAVMADPALSMSLEQSVAESGPDPFEEASQSMEAAFNHGLEVVVAQLEVQYAAPPPPQHDPFQLMEDMFNQQMQMMDPFNMMGPMG